VKIKWIKRHVGFSQKQDISFRGFSHHPFSMSGQGTPRRSRCRFSLGEHTMNTMSLSQLIRQQNLSFCALALKLTLVKTPNAICPLFILFAVRDFGKKTKVKFKSISLVHHTVRDVHQNASKKSRMLLFTFPLQLKGTCLPQKKCFARDLVYYIVF